MPTNIVECELLEGGDYLIYFICSVSGMVFTIKERIIPNIVTLVIRQACQSLIIYNKING